MCNEPGKVAQMRAGGNLGNASKKFSVFIRSCFTRCHFKIWNISFIAICHFHIWPEQLIFCADAAHKTNSVPVASNQAHNWTTRLIWVSTIFTVSINLIIVGQTVYCPNLGSRFAVDIWRKIKIIISAISSFWCLQGLLSPSRRARRSSCRCRRCGIQTSTWQKSDAMRKKALFFVYSLTAI